ncbi:hypothetical protein OG824_26625 [Streptomyces prunicolor]|uniref:hypothetical protein n=1 Tax=Streptomyces prunicolor TaxID=67348 RepID=UPI002255A262|nr:hypothetical protein [Streptomyces prunicolor]MCX5238781.1 hypothetical protein [Streptomyces prunicolor]
MDVVERATGLRAAPVAHDDLGQRGAGRAEQALLLEGREFHAVGDLGLRAHAHVHGDDGDRAVGARFGSEELPGVPLDPRVFDAMVDVLVAGDDAGAGHPGQVQDAFVGVVDLLDQPVGDPAAQPADLGRIAELPVPAQQTGVGDQVDGDVGVTGEFRQRPQDERQSVQRARSPGADGGLAYDVGEFHQVVGALRRGDQMLFHTRLPVRQDLSTALILLDLRRFSLISSDTSG